MTWNARTLIITGTFALLTVFAGRLRAGDDTLPVPVAVHTSTVSIYLDFLRSKIQPAEAVEDFSGPFAGRPVIAIVLLKKALAASGLKSDVIFIPAPNGSRHMKNIQSGTALMYGADMWNNVAEDDFYISEPLIPAGHFAKLFFFKDRAVAESIHNARDLRKYTGITVGHWEEDKKVLDRLGLRFITAPNWELMWNMLAHGRGDYVFLEPGCDAGPQTHYETRVYPVPGLKASFPEARSYLIYKKHPDASVVHEHLQKGLKLLKESGEIHKALTQSCIINETIKDWKDMSSDLARTK